MQAGERGGEFLVRGLRPADRGVKGRPGVVACDGLPGLAEATPGATWSQATIQTCTVHLIRSSMRLGSYSDRKAVAAWPWPGLHRR